jgi:hypothetical protein
MIELDEKRKTDEAEGSLIDVERAERVLEGMNKGRELAKGERLYGKTLLTDERVYLVGYVLPFGVATSNSDTDTLSASAIAQSVCERLAGCGLRH